MSKGRFSKLVQQTNNITLIWKDIYGIAPKDTAAKLNKAMLEWQLELTKTLELWIDKGLNMTVGELILARANLGAVVESWLKFFYCVYYEDYCKIPIKDRKGKIVEPEKMKFETLKKFSCEKLWGDEHSKEYLWVDSVQNKRNAIHSFQNRKIGSNQDLLDDIDLLYDFVDNIITHLPDIESCVEYLPHGYIISSLWD